MKKGLKVFLNILYTIIAIPLTIVGVVLLIPLAFLGLLISLPISVIEDIWNPVVVTEDIIEEEGIDE